MDYATKVKGKGLVLVTGKKGSGKSHFVTKVIADLRAKYPEHHVFSDITGMNIDGVLPSPADWRDAPHNSTIVYDEAQLLEWADNSSTKINSDERVRDMTLIRKQNKNIVLISQDPGFIHSALRKLVDYHYHLSHPFKDGKPKCYYFHGAISQIDDKGLYKSQAMEEFTHHLDDETSKLYQSIEPDAVHDQTRKIPKKIIYGVIFVVMLILVAIPLGIWGIKRVAGFIWGDGHTEAVNNVLNTATDGMDTITNNTFDADTVNQTPTNTELLALESKYLDAYTVEVANHDTLRPASIIAMGGKCRAYNKYGDGLNISTDKCLSMLDDPSTIPHPRIESVQNMPQLNESEQITQVQPSAFHQDVSQTQWEY